MTAAINTIINQVANQQAGYQIITGTMLNKIIKIQLFFANCETAFLFLNHNAALRIISKIRRIQIYVLQLVSTGPSAAGGGAITFSSAGAGS